ncbi:MAG: HD domain-containing protein [Comamonas sp.]|nr:HD domain-containing protein [Comamonas sp.]
MNIDTIQGRLAFLQEAEQLKSVLRSAHTSSGRAESTAEHTWRLCLMAMVFEDALAGLDMLKLLKMCLIHDLGEAIHGDIPATEQDQPPDKSTQEHADLLHLTRHLDEPQRNHILALWQEYEAATTPEAQAVKALDKLETILQHNQGRNPADFDYAFNLSYGQQQTSTAPLFALMRSLVDVGTRRRMAQGGNKQETADILNVSHPQNTRKRESEEAMAELARQAQALGMGYE